MAIGRTNCGVLVEDALNFTYTGIFDVVGDVIYLKSSGNFVCKKSLNFDITCIGGGGGTASRSNSLSSGAGGGYVVTELSKPIIKDTIYPVIIGAGGVGNASGGTTTAFSVSAAGGKGTIEYNQAGGNGGNGGGGASVSLGGTGGSNGNNGSAGSYATGGIGQGTTTRLFGESSGTQYAGGGGGAGETDGGQGGAGGGGKGDGPEGVLGQDGVANTGGGAGGSLLGTVHVGGSGLVAVRVSL
jgi:hypothetical protein